jgi:hypothetical protein
MEHPDTTSVTGTEFDVISMSDVRSEFSEYSNETRKSSLYNGLEKKKNDEINIFYSFITNTFVSLSIILNNNMQIF